MRALALAAVALVLAACGHQGPSPKEAEAKRLAEFRCSTYDRYSDAYPRCVDDYTARYLEHRPKWADGPKWLREGTR